MQNELEVLVSVDMPVLAIMDVESMRKSELSMRLTLFLPATATAVPALVREGRRPRSRVPYVQETFTLRALGLKPLENKLRLRNSTPVLHRGMAFLDEVQD